MRRRPTACFAGQDSREQLLICGVKPEQRPQAALPKLRALVNQGQKRADHSAQEIRENLHAIIRCKKRRAE